MAQGGILDISAFVAVGGQTVQGQNELFRGNAGRVRGFASWRMGQVREKRPVGQKFPEEAAVFADHDLHIHVPDGATPKDGPSAGITLTTAVASLITGHAVDPKIAMTGEISLRGEVTPIGGLPEKLMAAQRSGVLKVLIPQENEEDLQDVPQEIRDQLDIVPVSELDDVLRICGIRPQA